MKVDWGFSNIDNVYCHSPQRQGATADGTESSLRTVCEGHSSNPVVAFSPDIDYIFLIEVWFGDNHVRYNVDGCRDGFPHFELYIGGNAVIQEGDESNPYGLIGYCGTELHAEGQFTASGNNIIR